MTPIYSYLGANPDEIPLLNLAEPMTGLIIQPIVGALICSCNSFGGSNKPYQILKEYSGLSFRRENILVEEFNENNQEYVKRAFYSCI